MPDKLLFICWRRYLALELQSTEEQCSKKIREGEGKPRWCTEEGATSFEDKRHSFLREEK